jgi:hypothetical protein
MLNQYAVAPHYHNMVHLLAIMNKAELMRDCLERHYLEIKSISVKVSPLHFATQATTNILLGWLTKSAQKAVHTIGYLPE